MSDEPTRHADGRWVRGTASPNSGGRSKVQRAVQAVLDECGPTAATTITALLKSDDPRIALAAARDILDRVIGKPKESVEISAETVNEFLAGLAVHMAKPKDDDAG